MLEIKSRHLTWVGPNVWNEFSEYLMKTWVLTSSDFNMYPIRIFLCPYMPTATETKSFYELIAPCSKLYFKSAPKFGPFDVPYFCDTTNPLHWKWANNVLRT